MDESHKHSVERKKPYTMVPFMFSKPIKKNEVIIGLNPDCTLVCVCIGERVINDWNREG